MYEKHTHRHARTYTHSHCSCKAANKTRVKSLSNSVLTWNVE